MYDLIIIGGGPAGITAGIYAARQRLNTLLITKIFGGQMARKAVPIENYPGFEKITGLEIIQKFEKHLRAQKIDVEMGEVIKIKKEGEKFIVLTASKKQFESKTVIVSSGSDPRPLEVPGEKEFIGKGVSYCIACDAPLFVDKTVVVIGGGNAGFEAALALIKWAKEIYILEYNPEVKADPKNQEKAKKTGKIQVITNAVLKEIKGTKFVESIVYENRENKELKTFQAQGVFVEIGSQPATYFVEGLVEFNERDEIIVDPGAQMTSVPGLFAAGDIDNLPYKQIVIAAGKGAKAAISVSRYLQELK